MENISRSTYGEDHLWGTNRNTQAINQFVVQTHTLIRSPMLDRMSRPTHRLFICSYLFLILPAVVPSLSPVFLGSNRERVRNESLRLCRSYQEEHVMTKITLPLLTLPRNSRIRIEQNSCDKMRSLRYHCFPNKRGNTNTSFRVRIRR